MTVYFEGETPTKELKDILVPNNTCLLSTPSYFDTTEPAEFERKALMWSELTNRLRGWGYDTYLLQPRADYFTKLYTNQSPNNQVLVFEPEHHYDELCLHWPRDIVTRFDDRIYIRPERTSSIVERMLSTIYGDKWEKSALYSKLGEEGFVTRAGHCLLVSDIFKKRQGIIELSKSFAVVFLPVAHDDQTFLGQRMSLNGHIDTEIQHGVRRDGGMFLVSSADYWNRFEDAVRAAQCQFGISQSYICRYPNEIFRRAPNFWQLPRGEVVIPDRCPEFAEFIAGQVGRDNIYELPLDPIRDFKPGGGIRCMTKVL